MILAGLLSFGCAVRLSAQCPDGSAPPCARPAARAATSATSVAVLYFENASRDTADAYLADGLTEEIISRLGEVGRLQVKSRYLVRRFRGEAVSNPADIGRQLAVANIVTGSMRRSGARVRITAEMVRTTTGDVVWSERFDRAETDVLSLQEDLSNAVASAITGRLLPAERAALSARPTRSNEAWNHFVRGNYILARRTPAAYAGALAEYEEASRLDPAFSRALARASYVHGIAAWRGETFNGLTPDSSWRRARSIADRAVRADAGSSDAWMALGLAQMQQPESLAAARRSFERAIALDSSNAEAVHVYAWVWFYQGHTDEAIANFHRALVLEPGRPVTLAMLGFVAHVAGNYDEAIRWYDSSVSADRAFIQGYFVRSLNRFQVGDTAGFRADMDLARAMSSDVVRGAAAEPWIRLAAGDSLPLRDWTARTAARLAAWDGQDYALSQMLAMSYMLLGDREAVFAWLERTRWRNINFYMNIQMAPLSRLRGDPRYERLLDEWRIPAGIRR